MGSFKQGLSFQNQLLNEFIGYTLQKKNLVQNINARCVSHTEIDGVFIVIPGHLCSCIQSNIRECYSNKCQLLINHMCNTLQ